MSPQSSCSVCSIALTTTGRYMLAGDPKTVYCRTCCDAAWEHKYGSKIQRPEPKTSVAANVNSNPTSLPKKEKTMKSSAKKTSSAPASPKKAAPASKPVAADAAIKVKSTDHELTGKRGKAVDILLKSKTVESFREALVKAGIGGYAGWALKTARSLKLVTV